MVVSSPQGRFSKEAAEITETTLEKVTAHGKHLFFHFENNKVVHVHLGLYGWFRFFDAEDDDALSRGTSSVRMQMQTDWIISRLSGPTTCKLIDSWQVEEIVEKLGPDPIHVDSDKEIAWNKISKSRKTIASLLMDQSVIAGIGNVYRAEFLFMAGLYPYIVGADTTRESFDSLWSLFQKYMRLGSLDGVIRTVDYKIVENSINKPTAHQQLTWVYGRTGYPCMICGYAIVSSQVDGRTLYWCPECQA